MRCAVMSQQLLASSQSSPASGGEIDTGLRVCTDTGPTDSVRLAGISGGIGLATVTSTECVSPVGSCSGSAATTSSQTTALCPGPSTLVPVAGLPSWRVQYLRLSPDSRSNARSPSMALTELMVTLPDIVLVSMSS